MTIATLRGRIAWLLDYEPTWFPEFGSGLGILLWSAGCFLTNDWTVSGTDWLLPSIGLLFGPLRWVLLIRLWYPARMLAAFLAGVWWAWITCSLLHRMGIVPMLGAATAVFAMDALTTARFSMPAFRDLLIEFRSWRAR